MDCEVVVVGGGIGGLTVAALLAQRGLDVCLFEKESTVGGCAANFEKFGYQFERGYGLFTGWGNDEIHQRVFAELPVNPPTVSALQSYSVRLPDGGEVTLSSDPSKFESDLRRVFPECAERAVNFYRKLVPLAEAWRNAIKKDPDLLSASRARRFLKLLGAREVLNATEHSAAIELVDVSPRFRSFVDLQLQTFTQTTSEDISYLAAAIVLGNPLLGMFGMSGGANSLAQCLAESITKSGGRIRLNAPVLRLAYDAQGTPVGIDLLNGEQVKASKAIISNLTVWDTYGKLVGLNRTATEIRKQINALKSWGIYQIYVVVPEEQALAPNRVMVLDSWNEGQPYDPAFQFFLTASELSPDGKRALTMHNLTNVDDWFTFHQDQNELEQTDQKMLERCWERLHRAFPLLVEGAELIETASPQTFYELTRRKLGMVGGLPWGSSFWLDGASYETAFPNLFIVGDTTCSFAIEGITRSAWILANHLTT